MDANNNLKWVVAWFVPVNHADARPDDELLKLKNYHDQDTYVVECYRYQWFETLEMARHTLKQVTEMYYNTQPKQLRTHKPYISRSFQI